MQKNRSKKNVGLVILAAGNSSRLGRPKQLVEFNGESLLNKIVREAEKSVCFPIVAVLGSNKKKLEKHLQSSEISIVENINWQNGQGSSLAVGVSETLKIKPDIDGVLITVCDQPFVTSELINGAVKIFYIKKSKTVASHYAETLGVPALFDKTLFAELIAQDGEKGAKKIIEKYKDETSLIEFPEGATDIDFPEDIEKLKKSEVCTK